MDKQKLKSLTWKYFWQQKWEEVKLPIFFIIGLLVVVIISCIVGNIAPCQFKEDVSMCSTPLEKLANGFLLLMVTLGVLFLGFVIFIWAGEWILDNWTLAEKRAKKELKGK